MKATRYIGRTVNGAGYMQGINLPNRMDVQDFDREHLHIHIPGADGILLDAVQVDKLRQQFHEWLHERTQTPHDLRWVEI